MSSEFGYIPESPEQSFGNNKGIFTPTDIYDLTRADKYTNYGQLELIETKTGSGVSAIDFTDIKQDIYNVHFITITGSQSIAEENISLRFFENGTVQSGSNYDYAYLNGDSGGTTSQSRSTTQDRLFATKFADGGDQLMAYNYFYNLGDSTKYSFQTMQSITDHSGVFEYRFGSGVMHRTTYVDGIRFYHPSTGNISGTISLYGIKEYS